MNVEPIVNCVEDEEEIENLENLETVERDPSGGECGENLCLSSLTNKEEDGLIKAFEKTQDEGLRVDYRCPRCREHNDCRRLHDIERISPQKETEDQMVYDPVKIDRENKQIVCYLPVRGEEKGFL